MANALDGTGQPRPTLREQANAARITRARFIGNAVGLILVVAAIEIGLMLAGLKDSRTMGAATATVPNAWVSLGGSVVVFLALVDLAVRRRHDRGQSGADCVALLVLLELIYAAALFGLLASIPGTAVAAVAGLAGLYLLVALAILPGDRGDNRYGPPPYTD